MPRGRFYNIGVSACWPSRSTPRSGWRANSRRRGRQATSPGRSKSYGPSRRSRPTSPDSSRSPQDSRSCRPATTWCSIAAATRCFASIAGLGIGASARQHRRRARPHSAAVWIRSRPDRPAGPRRRARIRRTHPGLLDRTARASADFRCARDPTHACSSRALTLNGVSTLRATANQTILLNQPETGSLITEYDFSGQVIRTVGRLRATGHEATPHVHLAMNSGFPLPIPSGGYYFVFRSGAPHFQRYSAAGELMFERAIQGRELDRWLQASPPAGVASRPAGETTLPIVRSLVRSGGGRCRRTTLGQLLRAIYLRLRRRRREATDDPAVRRRSAGAGELVVRTGWPSPRHARRLHLQALMVDRRRLASR